MQPYSSTLELELLEIAKKNFIEKTVVGGVLLDRKGQSILLIKRHPSEFMPNILELPSGGVKKGETLTVALAREIQEETSLKMKEVLWFLNYFDYHSKSGKLTRQFNFIVHTENLEPIILNPEEHSSYEWQPLYQIKNLSQKMQEIFELTSRAKDSGFIL
jgi:8-oxo-dGTP diphosphatase